MPTNTSIKTFVTSPSLAPLQEYMEILQDSWQTGILTHHGPLVQEFEKQLINHIGMENLITTTNGTIAIQMAIKALDLKGEIITTPFTWVATINSIIWENCIPVFVDIDEDTLNINPENIESAISYRTSAILGVHVFSNPCDVDKIAEIAKRHNLKVIYDGAHAMSVKYNGKSIFEYGDISTTSFHATKLLNSGEGGACFASKKTDLERLKRMRFFGHNAKKIIIDMGLNGKMTEIHAGLGLVNLRYLEGVLNKRKEIYEKYVDGLNCSKGIRFQRFDSKSYNYSYMPVIFESERIILNVLSALNKRDIYPRRYFYPSMNTVKALGPYVPMPKSEKIAKTVLCLPSYTKLSESKIDEIIQIINSL